MIWAVRPVFRRFHLPLLLLACVAVPLTGSPSPAVAETSISDLTEAERQKMQEFLKAGKEEYEKGNFESAIPFLKKAHEIYPNPAFHYRIGLAYERSGHPEKALEYYKRFLEQAPDTDKRGQVEKTIARLESQVAEESRATIRIESSPAGAEVSIGAGSNETRGTTPMQMRVEPGEVKLVVEKTGRQSVSELVEVEAGKSYQYSYTLPPKQTGGGGAAGKAGQVRPWPIAFAGLGVAGLGTAAIYDLAAACTVNRNVATNLDCFEQGEYTQRVRTFWPIAGVGIAGLGTAGILWAVNGFTYPAATARTRRGRDGALSLQLSITPSRISVIGRF